MKGKIMRPSTTQTLTINNNELPIFSKIISKGYQIH